jgi:ABC-type sugar transport system substrate-binding protein
VSYRSILMVLLLAALAVLLVAGCQRPEAGGSGTTPAVGSAGPGPAQTTGGKTPATEAAATPDTPPAGYEFVFQADCKWLETNANSEMASALTRTDKIDVVFGHNDPSAHGAYMAAQQKGNNTEKSMLFVGIDALPHEGVKYVKDGILAATFQYPTGGAEAVKAAVLLLSNKTVPKNITLGTRIFTKETVDAGGEPVPPDKKEGWEGADVLDKEPLPTLTKTFLIGYSQCNRAEPWRVQMDSDVEAAAKQFPDLKLVMKDAQNKSEQQQADIRDFIAQKVDLIIISPKEAQPLSAPVEEAMAAGIPVIVLDRKLTTDNYTCFIGGDNIAIGREAGKWVRKQFPNGAKIVELQGLMTSTPAGERHQGFIEGLNIK